MWPGSQAAGTNCKATVSGNVHREGGPQFVNGSRCCQKQLDETETAAAWMLMRVAQQGDDLRSAQVLSQLEMLVLIISDGAGPKSKYL